MNFRNIEDFVLLLLLFVLCPETNSSVVKKSIVINGLSHDLLGTTTVVNGVNIEYFAKIPYAKPPIGDLRFKHPQDIYGWSWNGIYNSTTQPNTCWQVDGGEFEKLNAAARLWLSKTTMNEDCLYLTIWVPQTSMAKLPVMVWIYGGAFLSGSSTLEVYDGSILASRHNVIVVSLQYRLGPLGFFYIDETLAPGNQGLMDQRMALKWVKDNIGNFNGDNSKITIFGESAGSVSVSLHVLSPLSLNLFNRAIMESGTVLSPWAIETKEESLLKSIELAKKVNCGSVSNDMVKLSDCLSSVDPSMLTNMQFSLKALATKQRLEILKSRGITELFSDGSYFIDLYFKPIYDNYFVPKNVTSLLATPNARTNMDLLMGFNDNEGMYFLIYGLNTLLKFLDKGDVVLSNRLSSNSPNQINASQLILENLSNPKYAYKSLIPLIMYVYGVPSKSMGDTQWDSLDVMAALDQMTGDELFVCPVLAFAETMMANNRNLYVYKFGHRTEGVTWPKWMGSMHGYEIEYVFGMPFSKDFKKLYYAFNGNEEILSDAVMTLWTNFAKFGNPTPTPINYFNQSVSWLPYSLSTPHMFHFSASKDVPFRTSENSKKCRFWNNVLPSLISEFKGTKASMIVRMPWTLVIVVSAIILPSGL